MLVEVFVDDIDYPIPHERLAKAFVKDAVLEAWRSYGDDERTDRRAGGLWRLHPMVLGKVPIRSGRVVVGDAPMYFEMTAPFVRRIPSGEYTAVATIVTPFRRPWRLIRRMLDRLSLGTDPRVAYFGLILRDERPVTFEYARMEDVLPGYRPNDPFEGFGVDMGPAGIMDAEHLPQMKDLADDGVFCDLLDSACKRRSDTWKMAALADAPWNPPVRMACAATGWGDGEYRSYWGLNASGEAVQLIVDFDLPGEFAAFEAAKYQDLGE